jgi:hypothetical protein
MEYHGGVAAEDAVDGSGDDGGRSSVTTRRSTAGEEGRVGGRELEGEVLVGEGVERSKSMVGRGKGKGKQLPLTYGGSIYLKPRIRRPTVTIIL